MKKNDKEKIKELQTKLHRMKTAVANVAKIRRDLANAKVSEVEGLMRQAVAFLDALEAEAAK